MIGGDTKVANWGRL